MAEFAYALCGKNLFGSGLVYIMKENLSVVMLVNEFPPLKVGGGERQAEQLSMQLVRQGLIVGVITRGTQGLPDYETRDGFWVQRIQPRGAGKLKSLSFLFGTMRQLWQRRSDYHIIHAHLAFTPAIAAALTGKLLRKPVIVKFGNSGEFGDVQVSQATRRGRVKLALLRRWGKRFIALDQAMHAELLNAGFDPQRVQRMDNGVDAVQFQPADDRQFHKAELGLSGKTVLLFIGRLEAQKSLPLLIESFHTLSQSRPKVFLLLVGDGPDSPALAAQILALGLREQVRFVGNIRDVRPYLAASDIFVLPSVSEGMSNALLEAMSSGLACVVTRVGNAAEMLQNGACGVLVEPGNPHNLSGAFNMLLQNPKRLHTFGQKARQRVEEHYAIQIVGRKYQALYEELLHANSVFH